MQARPGHLFHGEIKRSVGSVSRRAAVRFDVRGLVVESDDTTGERIWPYASLAIPTGAVLQDGAIVLTSSREPGTVLTVRDRQFVASALQAVPHLSGRRATGPSWFPMVFSTFLIFALIGGLVYSAIAFLPYKTFARGLPDGTRETIGKLTVQNLTQGRKACEELQGCAAVDKLVQRLHEASGSPAKFKVTVVDWDLVNAFATMGNQVVITRGLIKAASSADEVAGVLAHEMGHSIEMHPEAGVLRAVGTVAVIKILLGGWSPDVLSDVGARVVLLSYSRDAEAEADLVGLKMLKGARIAPGGFAAFFERLNAEEKKKGGASIPDIFSTHPPLPDRAKRAREVADYPATPALTEAEWRAMREMCAAGAPKN